MTRVWWKDQLLGLGMGALLLCCYLVGREYANHVLHETFGPAYRTR
jgi:hypothetical protein